MSDGSPPKEHRTLGRKRALLSAVGVSADGAMTFAVLFLPASLVTVGRNALKGIVHRAGLAGKPREVTVVKGKLFFGI